MRVLLQYTRSGSVWTIYLDNSFHPAFCTHNISILQSIMVDLDESKILQGVGDEASILPSRLRRCLKVALQLVSNTTQPGDASRNVLVSEAFVRMFVEMCGHYRNHIVTQQDSMRVFEVRSRTSLETMERKKYEMGSDAM